MELMASERTKNEETANAASLACKQFTATICLSYSSQQIMSSDALTRVKLRPRHHGRCRRC